MNIAEAKCVIHAASVADDTVIIEGVHGIGKSDIVKQFAKENDYHIETLFLSQQEVGDLIGIPTIVEDNGNQLTVWSVPIWLQRMRDASKLGKRCVVFLDELNRAPLDVRQSALQLVLERQIHEHKLPELEGVRTLVVAAINPDSSDYQTDALDPALLDRFLLAKVDVDVPAWLDWARNSEVNTAVRDFIVNNPKFLHHTPTEGIGATPRSWAKLGDYLDNIQDMSDTTLLHIIRGKIGADIAGQFYMFYRDYSNIVTIADVEKVVADNCDTISDVEELADLLRELTVSLESPQKMELAHQLGDKYMINDNKLPLLAYLYAMDIEICVAFLKNLRNNKSELYVDLAKFDDTINDKKLFKRIVQAAKSEKQTNIK